MENEHNQCFSTWTKICGVKKLKTLILAEMFNDTAKGLKTKAELVQ